MLQMLNLSGVNVEAVKSELQRYVQETTPRNASGGGVITTQSNPACGRPRAIELTERVVPILRRLYPNWQDENERRRNFEFAAERDACARLLARIESDEEITDLFSEQDDAPQLSASHLHDLVWSAASAQWATGHRHEAVLAAAKAVNSRLQEKTQRRDLSEARLVREAFSEKSAEPDKPRLRFPEVEDDQTRESLRQGVMAFGAGCFQAIRNPVGHLPN
ncbi:MAG TPA: TIGR02391 family protein, partial [Pyrinomonadaceae bacterium]